jgi:hypothetical protein
MKMKNIKYLIVLVIFNMNLFAQSGGSSGLFNPRATALGNTYTASARGVYTIGINPANLAIPLDNTVQLSTVFPLPNLNFSLGNDFFNANEFNYFFAGTKDPNGDVKGKLLTDADKKRFLALFDNGSEIRAGFSVPIFALSINASKEVGSFGFGIEDRFGMQVNLPKDLFDFALFGNDVGKTFNLDDLASKESYLRYYTFSYARDLTDLLPDGILQRFSAGVSVKMVKGYAYAKATSSGATITTLTDHSVQLNNQSEINIAVSPDFGIVWDFEGDIKKEQNIGPFPTPAGKGIGFDLGFSAQLNDTWSFGIALTDIGKVNWENEIVTYSSSGSYTVTKADTTVRDSLIDRFKWEGKYGDPFSTSLPTAVRIGTAFRLDKFLEGDFPGKMLIVAGLNEGFNDEPGNSKTPRFSLGCEWKPADWFPIRTGVSFGGLEGFNWGFGFGLDAGVLSFDFAAANLNSIVSPNTAKKIGLSIGSRWRF